VGITEPLANWREGDPMAAIASLSDRAISTSGDYQKFFVDAAGRRLSHVFDLRTGWPVQHGIGGVSVVASDSMTADALATTLFVLGEREGLAFIEQWPEAGALFIVREPDGQYRQVRSRRFAELAGLSP
jgi:thiamine biosynthesis lipoprotein